MDPRIPPVFLCLLCRTARTRALLTRLIVPSTYIVWSCTNGANRIEQAQQQATGLRDEQRGATAASSQQIPGGPVSREDRGLLVSNGSNARKVGGCENCVGMSISGRRSTGRGRTKIHTHRHRPLTPEENGVYAGEEV